MYPDLLNENIELVDYIYDNNLDLITKNVLLDNVQLKKVLIRNGKQVVITNGLFTGKVNINDLSFNGSVKFVRCEFNDTVKLILLRNIKKVIFDKCTFYDDFIIKDFDIDELIMNECVFGNDVIINNNFKIENTVTISMNKIGSKKLITDITGGKLVSGILNQYKGSIYNDICISKLRKSLNCHYTRNRLKNERILSKAISNIVNLSFSVLNTFKRNWLLAVGIIIIGIGVIANSKWSFLLSLAAQILQVIFLILPSYFHLKRYRRRSISLVMCLLILTIIININAMIQKDENIGVINEINTAIELNADIDKKTNNLILYNDEKIIDIITAIDTKLRENTEESTIVGGYYRTTSGITMITISDEVDSILSYIKKEYDKKEYENVLRLCYEYELDMLSPGQRIELMYLKGLALYNMELFKEAKQTFENGIASINDYYMVEEISQNKDRYMFDYKFQLALIENELDNFETSIIIIEDILEYSIIDEFRYICLKLLLIENSIFLLDFDLALEVFNSISDEEISDKYWYTTAYYDDISDVLHILYDDKENIELVRYRADSDAKQIGNSIITVDLDLERTKAFFDVVWNLGYFDPSCPTDNTVIGYNFNSTQATIITNEIYVYHYIFKDINGKDVIDIEQDLLNDYIRNSSLKKDDFFINLVNALYYVYRKDDNDQFNAYHYLSIAYELSENNAFYRLLFNEAAELFNYTFFPQNNDNDEELLKNIFYR